MKFLDIDVDNSGLSATGNIFATVCPIAQGDSESERIGRECTIVSIHWTYTIGKIENSGAATPSNPDVVRVMMFVDTQCNGATATVTGILNTAHFQSFPNLTEGDRFYILHDEVFDMSNKDMASNAANTFANSGVTMSWYFETKCFIPLQFDGVVGQIEDLTSNNVGVLLINKESALTNFESTVRLRYFDE